MLKNVYTAIDLQSVTAVSFKVHHTSFLTHFILISQQMLTIAAFLVFQTVITRAKVQETFFNTEKNSVLSDETPISVKRADSQISCSQLCSKDNRCKSANFIISQRTCSLLDKTRKTHPQRFLKQTNVIHLEKVFCLVIYLFRGVHCFLIKVLCMKGFRTLTSQDRRSLDCIWKCQILFIP